MKTLPSLFYTGSYLQDGSDRDAANLLAALTERHVLLFDVRRPAQPLLQWPHGLSAARPQLLSLFCRPTPEREVTLIMQIADGPCVCLLSCAPVEITGKSA